MPDEKAIAGAPRPPEAGSREYLELLLAECRQANFFPGGAELIAAIETTLDNMPTTTNLEGDSPPV